MIKKEHLSLCSFFSLKFVTMGTYTCLTPEQEKRVGVLMAQLQIHIDKEEQIKRELRSIIYAIEKIR